MRLPENMGRNSDNRASQYELQAYFRETGRNKLAEVGSAAQDKFSFLSVVG